jgi:hypothetical protein
MTHSNNLSETARSAITQQLEARPTLAGQSARSAGKKIEIAESLPVWTLSADLGEAQEDDLDRVAVSAGQWHLQIHHDDSPEEFVIAVNDGTGDETWRVRATFSSPLAKQIDEALKSIDHRAISKLRLLVVPSRQIYALWFKKDGVSYVLVAYMPNRHERHLRYKHHYGGKDFLTALKQTERIKGLPAPPVERSRQNDRVRKRLRDWAPKCLTDCVLKRLTERRENLRWGLLTLGTVAALGLCACWVAHTGPARPPPTGSVSVDLTTKWLVVEAVIVVAWVFVGCFAYRRPDGIFIDDRYRISLSRFQWVVWAALLFGAYFTESVWNISHGYSIPRLQPDLLKLMGIVVTAPVISNVIVDHKKSDSSRSSSAPGARPTFPTLPTPAPAAGLPAQIGSIDRNVTPSEASWADLYLGEEVANRNVVDVSRLQKLIITLLLVITYCEMLWEQLGHVVVAAAAKSTPSVGAAMPSVDTGFLWLLGISYGAYLAYKATPKTPSS